jgi:glutaredoxin-related protein
MNRYELVNVYSLSKMEKPETCDHCKKAIKDVYVVHDNFENIDIKVGSTCIGHIMNLTETFDKALQKELKKYSKLLKSINEFDAEKEVQKLSYFN